MEFKHIGHNYCLYAEHIAWMFFKKYENVKVITSLEKQAADTLLSATVTYNDKTETSKISIKNEASDYVKKCKHQLGACVYNACHKLTGKSLPFGYLCGVRPAKIATDILLSGGTKEEAYKYYTDIIKMSHDKARACVNVAYQQRDVLSVDREKRCNLYISIPFCPSRCNYCSFVSHSIARAGDLVEPYLELLLRELEKASRLIKEAGITNDTVYVGGGTPGILNEQQIKKLCDAVNKYFYGYSEFTYEFGRADVASEEKFRILKSSGVTRVCVNPQILSDAVLETNGRRHTVKQFYDAFSMARFAGFDNINCDIIAGLPSSTPEIFEDTVKKLITLGADDITMHTLAIKRSSDFYNESFAVDDKLAEESFNRGDQLLLNAGYQEYYMYRQKNAGGNLENKGYALSGKKSVYNIVMMGDAATVISVGAGGITKLVGDNCKMIKRVCNFKYPYEYLEKPEKIDENHKLIREFFNSKR